MRVNGSQSGGSQHRYSAKRMRKPVNFFCLAPKARSVVLVGDFNDWRLEGTPMTRQADGSWRIEIPLPHGHHCYQFLVDGETVLDPDAQGIARNAKNERVSMIAVS